MASRWDVERALMWSNLRPLARFVVLAVATKANAETGIVPPEHTPSLATLADMTGLAKSSVAKELAYLDKLAWVKRSAPSRGGRYGRTEYAINVGRQDPDRRSCPPHGHLDADVRHTDNADEPSCPPHGQTGVRDTDTSNESVEETAVHEQSATRTSPPDGHATTTTNQKTTTKETSPPKKPRVKVRDIPRPDVDELCQRLADWMIKNECKPPTISQEWRDEARRMLDIDKRDFTKAMNLLDWCQKSVFWRGNIESMPTFREKYDKLRLQALAEHEAKKSGRNYDGPYGDTKSERDYSKGTL